jgi:hypothetical protein
MNGGPMFEHGIKAMVRRTIRRRSGRLIGRIAIAWRSGFRNAMV